MADRGGLPEREMPQDGALGFFFDDVQVSVSWDANADALLLDSAAGPVMDDAPTSYWRALMAASRTVVLRTGAALNVDLGQERVWLTQRVATHQLTGASLEAALDRFVNQVEGVREALTALADASAPGADGHAAEAAVDDQTWIRI
ncbi:MAG: type III secretion system chaperone [Paracoccaceae bacterium]